YDELEFRTFKKRINEENISVGTESQISLFDNDNFENKEIVKKDSININYLDNEDDIKNVVKNANINKKVALKFLLDNDRALYSNAIALGIYDGTDIYYVDFDKVNEETI